MAVAPAFEPVASWKTWMNGKPVGEARTSSTLPRLNNIASTIPNPRRPLIPTEAIMLFGMTSSAASISSAERKWLTNDECNKFTSKTYPYG
jgi:hypothetical protein